MDNCLKVLRAALDVINRQQAVINLVIPTAHDMGECLMADRKPTPEQVRAWDAANFQVTAKMTQLTAKLIAVRQAADPLFRYDA